MTDEQLAALRLRVAAYGIQVLSQRITPSVGMQNAAGNDLLTLLQEVDFLRALLHDLQQDSTAYQRGLEEGIRQERERCAALCAEELRQAYKQEHMITHIDAFNVGAEICTYCAEEIRKGLERAKWVRLPSS